MPPAGRPQTTDHRPPKHRVVSIVSRRSSVVGRQILPGHYFKGGPLEGVTSGSSWELTPSLGQGIVTGVTSVPGLGNYPRAVELRIENEELRISIVADACFSPFYILHSQFRW